MIRVSTNAYFLMQLSRSFIWNGKPFGSEEERRRRKDNEVNIKNMEYEENAVVDVDGE